jgi:hypothetical protein
MSTISGVKPVAGLKAVGHQVVDVSTERLETAHRHGAGTGAVAVIVGDDQNLCAVASIASASVAGSAGRMGEARGIEQAFETVVELARTLHTARGVKPGQQRCEPGCETRRASAASSTLRWTTFKPADSVVTLLHSGTSSNSAALPRRQNLYRSAALDGDFAQPLGAAQNHVQAGRFRRPCSALR